MAKELPYFKFEPNAWENGNIQILSREEKGLFVDLCSMYWSRLGDLPVKLAAQKLCGGNATAFNSLCEEKIIEIIDGVFYIKFLSEQLLEFENLSSTNSKNAKDGWEKRRAAKALSESNATASNRQCETDAIREEKRREEEITTTIKPYKKDDVFDLDSSIILCLSSNKWVEEMGRLYKIPENKLPLALSEFKSHRITSYTDEPIAILDFKKHFTNWVRTKKYYHEKNKSQ